MPTIDVVSGTAEANGRVRDRMRFAQVSYLTAVSDEMTLLARCIANEALRGDDHWAPWLGEYLALNLLRDRCLASHDQQRAERERLVAEWQRGDRLRTEQLGCQS